MDVTIDGKVTKGDKRRAGGVHANAAMWVDPHLKNTCMIDKVGGSVSFYDTWVNSSRSDGPSTNLFQRAASGRPVGVLVAGQPEVDALLED